MLALRVAAKVTMTTALFAVFNRMIFQTLGANMLPFFFAITIIPFILNHKNTVYPLNLNKKRLFHPLKTERYPRQDALVTTMVYGARR